MVINDVTQEMVHRLATVWHNPGTLSKKCSPSSLPVKERQIYEKMHLKNIRGERSYNIVVQLSDQGLCPLLTFSVTSIDSANDAFCWPFKDWADAQKNRSPHTWATWPIRRSIKKFAKPVFLIFSSLFPKHYFMLILNLLKHAYILLTPLNPTFI